MNMTNASDEDQLATEGFVDTRQCPGCELLRGEIKRHKSRIVHLRAALARIHCLAMDPQHYSEGMEIAGEEAAKAMGGD